MLIVELRQYNPKSCWHERRMGMFGEHVWVLPQRIKSSLSPEKQNEMALEQRYRTDDSFFLRKLDHALL